MNTFRSYNYINRLEQLPAFFSLQMINPFFKFYDGMIFNIPIDIQNFQNLGKGCNCNRALGLLDSPREVGPSEILSSQELVSIESEPHYLSHTHSHSVVAHC